MRGEPRTLPVEVGQPRLANSNVCLIVTTIKHKYSDSGAGYEIFHILT